MMVELTLLQVFLLSAGLIGLGGGSRGEGGGGRGCCWGREVDSVATQLLHELVMIPGSVGRERGREYLILLIPPPPDKGLNGFAFFVGT